MKRNNAYHKILETETETNPFITTPTAVRFIEDISLLQ